MLWDHAFELLKEPIIDKVDFVILGYNNGFFEVIRNHLKKSLLINLGLHLIDQLYTDLLLHVDLPSPKEHCTDWDDQEPLEIHQQVLHSVHSNE